MQQSKKQKISSVSSIELPAGQSPPHDTDIEEKILGLVMMHDKDGAMDVVIGHLTPEAFYREGHQRVYQAMLTMYQKSQPIDVSTVVDQLRVEGLLEVIGGAYAVAKMTNSIVTSSSLEHYCLRVREMYMRREMIRIGAEMYQQGFQEKDDIFDLLDATEQSVMGIGAKLQTEAMSTDAVLIKTISKIEEWRHLDSTVTGVPSGFPKLNRVTRGWQNGDLIILAARPAVGKTAMALALARAAAQNDIRSVPVGLWTLEMDADRLMLRMMAAESGMLLHRLQTGRLDDAQMKMLHTEAIAEISKLPIYWDDKSDLSIFSLRAKARRLKRKHNIGFIIVDYLQLMTGTGSNREQEIASISKGLKRLARELKVPIIALSQLSREVEKRTGTKRIPQLSDLRESGAIEQDADMVLFLYGPTEDEVEKDASLLNKRYLKIAKSRDGMLATVDLEFQNEIQLFKEAQQQGLQGEIQLPPGNFKPISNLFDHKPNT